MTWDLREEVLLALWRAEGHEFRPMGGPVGAVLCLRCNTIVHVRSRARAMDGYKDASSAWNIVDPSKVTRCWPRVNVSPS